jgi:hypothetical protein
MVVRDARQRAPQKSLSGLLSMKEVLGGVANVASIVTSGAFLLSVIYEQAYFLVIGRKFQDIASLSDYLTSVLGWLPAVAGGSLAYFLFCLLLGMIMRQYVGQNAKGSGSPEVEAASREGAEHAVGSAGQEEKMPAEAGAAVKPLTPTHIWSLGIVTVVWGGGGAFVYFYSDPASELYLLSMCFFFVWITICGLVVTRGNQDFMGPTARGLFILAPPVIVGVILLGLQRGYGDLTQPGEGYSLIRSQSEPQHPEHVNVLRTFERGVLIRLVETQVNEFLRWDQIRSIRLQRDGEASKSLGCRQLGWGC